MIYINLRFMPCISFIFFCRSAESKLNNFTRLEPVLHLLEVPFDTNVARDIMTEKHSVATRLMYQVSCD